MPKFNTAPSATTAITSPHVCMSCGWDFKALHRTPMDNGHTRTETRTQINLATRAGLIVRCDECYVKFLGKVA